ncbi:MAG: ATP-binding protein, partial [Bacteroidia bacterium]|nr:ATP-binding protein [Bacteroidia bacterium]
LVIKHASPASCTIEVSDTGCGIDKETLDNLFEMFPPTKTQLGKKMKARGMSLSVVKKLCTMMEIGIEVSSQLGAGTSTRLTIPSRTL